MLPVVYPAAPVLLAGRPSGCGSVSISVPCLRYPYSLTLYRRPPPSPGPLMPQSIRDPDAICTREATDRSHRRSHMRSQSRLDVSYLRWSLVGVIRLRADIWRSHREQASPLTPVTPQPALTAQSCRTLNSEKTVYE